MNINIFKRKKALLAEIEDLRSQIKVQSKELDNEKTKSGNLKFDLNNMTYEFNNAQSRIKQLMKEMDKKDIEQAALLAAKIQEIEKLKTIIDNQDTQINELQDTNNGLASSVSELKGKLKAKEKRVRELNTRIDDLKSKLKRYTDHEPQPHKD